MLLLVTVLVTVDDENLKPASLVDQLLPINSQSGDSKLGAPANSVLLVEVGDSLLDAWAVSGAGVLLSELLKLTLCSSLCLNFFELITLIDC